MLTMMLATCLLMTGQGATLWLQPYELGPDGVSIPEEASYAIWAWVKAEQPTQVTVAGKRFELTAAKDKKSGEYVWAKAGAIDLKPGALPLSVAEDVKGLILSTDPNFDARRALEDTRVCAEPKAVDDRRARTAKHTDTVFTMPHFESQEAWTALADKLRRRMLLGSGLLPLPERTPLKAAIFDKVTHEDYTVEKVHFEARPGFLVTGNLYRPVGDGPFPAVVCPHGHWKNGRLQNDESCSVPGRCITLARMGILAFSYDMIGYVDSLQFEHNWGSEREKLWGLHPFSMQLWSSIRAVDFVSELPGVDTERIGCTGASGGGTQTFALYSVDPRIAVAAPVNMISSSMQGGCLCENAPIIRLENSNMEIGALMAPKPLLMISATGDWTRETLRVEYPAIREIYGLFGAEDHVEAVQFKANHNYNRDSREAMYRFFGKWLLPGRDWSGFAEPAFTVEEEKNLRVFPDKDAVKDYPSKEKVIESVIAEAKRKWAAIRPQEASGLDAFREEYGDVLALVMGASIPAANDLAPERTARVERDGYVVEHWILGRRAVGDAIPAIFYHAYDPKPQDAVLVVHGAGKAALADLAQGAPGPLVKGLLDQGKAVLCIDAFLTGEHNGPEKPTERFRKGNFMDTFQPTDTGCRVQDVLTALAFLRARRDMSGNVNLLGLQDGGLWCLFASAIDGQVPVTAADMNHFALDDDAAWVKTCYVPCIRAIGDVQTAATLIAPRRLIVMNAADASPERWFGARAEKAMIETPALLELLR